VRSFRISWDETNTVSEVLGNSSPKASALPKSKEENMKEWVTFSERGSAAVHVTSGARVGRRALHQSFAGGIKPRGEANTEKTLTWWSLRFA